MVLLNCVVLSSFCVHPDENINTSPPPKCDGIINTQTGIKTSMHYHAWSLLKHTFYGMGEIWEPKADLCVDCDVDTSAHLYLWYCVCVCVFLCLFVSVWFFLCLFVCLFVSVCVIWCPSEKTSSIFAIVSRQSKHVSQEENYALYVWCAIKDASSPVTHLRTIWSVSVFFWPPTVHSFLFPLKWHNRINCM